MLGPERVSGVAILVAFGCLGTFGNILILVVFITRLVTGMETDYGNFATLSLAMTGFFISSYYSTMAVVSSLSTNFLSGMSPGKGPVSEGVCQLTGWIHVLCYLSAFLSIMFIAIHRYLAILNPINYKNVLSKSRCVVATGFIWAVSASWASSPFFGWGEYKTAPDSDTPLCLLHYSNRHSYVLVTSFGISLIPTIITVMCFWKCGKCLNSVAHVETASQTRADVSLESDDTEVEVGPTSNKQKSWASIESAHLKADILVAVTFAVFNLPLCIFVTLPTVYHPQSSLFWTIIIGSVYFSVQWIFVCMYNSNFAESKEWLMAKTWRGKISNNKQQSIT